MGLFKKLKKAVVKVGTLGAAGPGGWGGKAIGALSGGLVGDSSVYGAQGGLGSLTGNNSVAADAAEAARRQAEALQQQQATIQSNFAADLRGENLSSVVAGGLADADGSLDPTKRKKASGLSSTLGFS